MDTVYIRLMCALCQIPFAYTFYALEDCTIAAMLLILLCLSVH